MKNKTFETWMAEVDSAIDHICQMSSSDLPDCCYGDWFSDGMSPKAAANRAISNAND